MNVGQAKNKIQQKIKRVKRKLKVIKIEVTQFSKDNPEVAIATIPLAIGMVRAGQSLVISHRVAKERKRIDTTWYDPRTGMHWELKRKLTNGERAEILRRRSLGQDAYDILMKMRVLK